MANVHAVVRTDLMFGTDVRSGLVSVEYLGADGATPTAIENGNVLKIGALKDGEREVYVGGDVAASDDLANVVLIATPEVMYDEHKHNIDEFVNEAGDICRGYRLHVGDVFSVTEEALANASPAVGQVVELAAGTKLSNVASASGATKVGTIIAVETAGRYTYYVIKVD